MIAEGIELTCYRADGAALVDLYARQDIAGSIVLRGRPLTTVAAGTRLSIEAVLEQACTLTAGGLVAMVRVQLMSDDIDPVAITDDPGGATKLTVYLGSRDRVYGAPASEVICEILHRRGIPGATVLPGIDGNALGRRQQARFLSRDAGAPVMVIAVGTGDRIGLVLPELGGLLRRPVITLEQVRVCKRDGALIHRPEDSRSTGEHGFPCWQKLTVYASEAARHDGHPIHRAIVRRLRAAGIRVVATHRGIWGFRGDQPPHGDYFFRLAHHVPAVTSVIGAPGHMREAFGIVDELTSECGLVTSEPIHATNSVAGQREMGGL